VYIPDDDICGSGGFTDTYAVYYETGTPYWNHIFNAHILKSGDEVAYRADILYPGAPPTTGSAVHIGRTSGATVFIQTSSGTVLPIDAAVPLIESNIKYWFEEYKE
jgi:hypothetical protein